LWPVPVAAAAVTTRTRAVRRGKLVPAAGSVTERAIVEVDLLPFARQEYLPVPKAAEAFVATVLSLTKTAVAGDELEVRRMPSAHQPMLWTPVAH
jgi:hypothetical protein